MFVSLALRFAERFEFSHTTTMFVSHSGKDMNTQRWSSQNKTLWAKSCVFATVSSFSVVLKSLQKIFFPKLLFPSGNTAQSTFHVQCLRCSQISARTEQFWWNFTRHWAVWRSGTSFVRRSWIWEGSSWWSKPSRTTRKIRCVATFHCWVRRIFHPSSESCKSPNPPLMINDKENILSVQAAPGRVVFCLVTHVHP